METRRALAHRFAQTIVPDCLTIDEASRGWPTPVTIKTSQRAIPVDLYLAPVIESGRGADNERRIENPGAGRPIVPSSSRLLLVIGLWEEEGAPVLVAWDPYVRLNNLTRVSCFVPLALMRRAAAMGWADHVSDSGETIVAFRPAYLSVVTEMRAQGVALPPSVMSTVIAAAGENDAIPLPPSERIRREASRLIRNARFSSDVRHAYGYHCAMCGFDLGLLDGAHIYPVEAGDSADAVWNGLALCKNHHAAFDRHLIAVTPRGRAVQFHPQLVANAQVNKTTAVFLNGTYPVLAIPSDPVLAPRPDMFERRYSFYGDSYDWFGHARRL